MAVPDYERLMLPLLKLASDGMDHTLGEAIEKLAALFGLTDEDRKERLPSGAQAKFDNRVGWARTYLKKAGLLESAARGTFRTTKRGLEVLAGEPTSLDNKFLRQFPEFLEFQGVSRRAGKHEEEVEPAGQTPQEILELGYQNLRRNLAQELLERAKKSSARRFEELVVDLLVAMGYGGSRKDAGQAIGRSGDGGIDGIIKEDKLGLDVVCIQAKKWEANVGRPIVQGFAGSLDGQRAKKGVLITTSQFSQDAKDYVSRIEKKIVLIDGEELAQLMIDHGIGVTEVSTYTVKRIDLDYFGEE
ncbi:MAG: restriction endonuclease [Chloroflexi bacterium]|nr:restriction endonuclease [Chloroflexota bacterium]